MNQSCRRQHRYGDDCDDARSPDAKGYESGHESDEGSTYLALWKKQRGGRPSHRSSKSSDCRARSLDVGGLKASYEDTPIRPGIGPGSYARTFEELLEQTLKAQVQDCSVDESVEGSQSDLDANERRVPENGFGGDACQTKDEEKKFLDECLREEEGGLAAQGFCYADEKKDTCFLQCRASVDNSQGHRSAGKDEVGRATGRQIREEHLCPGEREQDATKSFGVGASPQKKCLDLDYLDYGSSQPTAAVRLPSSRKNLAVSWEDGHLGRVHEKMDVVMEVAGSRTSRGVGSSSICHTVVTNEVHSQESAYANAESSLPKPVEEDCSTRSVTKQKCGQSQGMVDSHELHEKRDVDEVKVQESENSSCVLSDGEGPPSTRREALEPYVTNAISEAYRIFNQSRNDNRKNVQSGCRKSVEVYSGFGSASALSSVQSQWNADEEKGRNCHDEASNRSQIAFLAESDANMKEEDMVSDPVSSCDESISDDEKESVDDCCNVGSLDNSVPEKRAKFVGNQQVINLHTNDFSVERMIALQDHQIEQTEFSTDERLDENSNEVAVKFEDILALLNLKGRGCRQVAPYEVDSNFVCGEHDSSLRPDTVNDGCHASGSCDVGLLRNDGCAKSGSYGSANLEDGFVSDIDEGSLQASGDAEQGVHLRHSHVPTACFGSEGINNRPANGLTSPASAKDDDCAALCSSGNDFDGFLLNVDSYCPGYLMEILGRKESDQSVLSHQDYASALGERGSKWPQHYDDQFGVNNETRLCPPCTIQDHKGTHAECHLLKPPPRQGSSDREQGSEFDFSDVEEEVRSFKFGSEIPLRACLVPLQDLVSQPRQYNGGYQIGTDKHKAVILYKNPLWTDESCGDLDLLLSNCQIRDASDTDHRDHHDEDFFQQEFRPQRVDRRKGWNVDGSMAVEALRMASLLVPDEEDTQDTQGDNSDYDSGPVRKRCKCSLHDVNCGSQPCFGHCERNARACEDASKESKHLWLSRSSLLNGYSTESVTVEEGGHYVRGKTDFLESGSVVSENPGCSTGVIQFDRGRVDALQGILAVKKQHEFHLSNMPYACDSVDELIAFVDQDNQEDATTASYGNGSSQSGWISSANLPDGQKNLFFSGSLDTAHPLWRGSSEKSESLLKSAPRSPLQHEISLRGIQRSEDIFECQVPVALKETETLTEIHPVTMTGHQAYRKGYRKYRTDSNEGKQLARSDSKDEPAQGAHDSADSRPVSPKSVMQAGHILEVDNDFGDCVVKDNQSSRKDGFRVWSKTSGNTVKDSPLSSGRPEPKISVGNTSCGACGPGCGDETKIGAGGACGCVYKEDKVMTKQSKTFFPQPSSKNENHHVASNLKESEKSEKPVDETEQLLAALELEEFRFLERRVRKEVRATNSLPLRETNTSRPAGALKAPDTKGAQSASFSLPSSLAQCIKVTPEAETSGGEQPAKSFGKEFTAMFDDRNSWADESQPAKPYGHPQAGTAGGLIKAESSPARPHVDRCAQRACAEEVTESDPTSKLVRSYFFPGKMHKGSLAKGETHNTRSNKIDPSEEGIILQKKVEALEEEIWKFQTETRKLQKMAKEYEEKASQLAEEKSSWEQQRNRDLQGFQEYKDEEMRKVKKHHQTLEKLSQELLQLPTKKERNQIEELKAQIIEIKEENTKKDSRWRLTNKRLRGIIEELTGQNRELQEEIKRYEARLHREWQDKDSSSVSSKCERGTSIDYNVMSISMRERSQYISTEGYASCHEVLGSSAGLKMSSEVLQRQQKSFQVSDPKLGSGVDARTSDITAKFEASLPKCKGARDMTTVTDSTIRAEKNVSVYTSQSRYSNKSMDNEGHAKDDFVLPVKSTENRWFGQKNAPFKFTSFSQSERANKGAVAVSTEHATDPGESQSQGTTTKLGPPRLDSSANEFVETFEEPMHLEAGKGQLTVEGEIQGSGGSSIRYVEDNNSLNDGSSSIIVPNGTGLEDNVAVDDCVYFANGDIKNALPDGSIEYYYSEVDTWHTTKRNGVEIFYFPDYQVEEHWPNGQKKIISPDGSFYIIGGENGFTAV